MQRCRSGRGNGRAIGGSLDKELGDRSCRAQNREGESGCSLDGTRNAKSAWRCRRTLRKYNGGAVILLGFAHSLCNCDEAAVKPSTGKLGISVYPGRGRLSRLGFCLSVPRLADENSASIREIPSSKPTFAVMLRSGNSGVLQGPRSKTAQPTAFHC